MQTPAFSEKIERLRADRKTAALGETYRCAQLLGYKTRSKPGITREMRAHIVDAGTATPSMLEYMFRQLNYDDYENVGLSNIRAATYAALASLRRYDDRMQFVMDTLPNVVHTCRDIWHAEMRRTEDQWHRSVLAFMCKDQDLYNVAFAFHQCLHDPSCARCSTSLAAMARVGSDMCRPARKTLGKPASAGASAGATWRQAKPAHSPQECRAFKAAMRDASRKRATAAASARANESANGDESDAGDEDENKRETNDDGEDDDDEGEGEGEGEDGDDDFVVSDSASCEYDSSHDDTSASESARRELVELKRDQKEFEQIDARRAARKRRREEMERQASGDSDDDGRADGGVDAPAVRDEPPRKRSRALDAVLATTDEQQASASPPANPIAPNNPPIGSVPAEGARQLEGSSVAGALNTVGAPPRPDPPCHLVITLLFTKPQEPVFGGSQTYSWRMQLPDDVQCDETWKLLTTNTDRVLRGHLATVWKQ